MQEYLEKLKDYPELKEFSNAISLSTDKLKAILPEIKEKSLFSSQFQKLDGQINILFNQKIPRLIDNYCSPLNFEHPNCIQIKSDTFLFDKQANDNLLDLEIRSQPFMENPNDFMQSNVHFLNKSELFIFENQKVFNEIENILSDFQKEKEIIQTQEKQQKYDKLFSLPGQTSQEWLDKINSFEKNKLQTQMEPITEAEVPPIEASMFKNEEPKKTKFTSVDKFFMGTIASCLTVFLTLIAHDQVKSKVSNYVPILKNEISVIEKIAIIYKKEHGSMAGFYNDEVVALDKDNFFKGKIASPTGRIMEIMPESVNFPDDNYSVNLQSRGTDFCKDISNEILGKNFSIDHHKIKTKQDINAACNLSGETFELEIMGAL